MGAYAACWLDDYLVGATRKGVDPGLMDLFRANDRIVVTEKGSQLPLPLRHWAREFADDQTLSVVYYRTSVSIARDRLEIAGYTLATAREAFASTVKGEIADLEARVSGEQGAEWHREELAKMRRLQVDEWLQKLRQEFSEFELAPESTTSDERMSVAYSGATGWGGYPGHDPRIALRLMIEALPDTRELIYDLTDLVSQEYLALDEEPHRHDGGFPRPTYPESGRTVILTEGRTDSWILQESLQLLYPHLSDYFSFMDFDGFRVGGGAGVLVNLVKAFAGAGIVNKTIAVFDNDTAARVALGTLKSVRLPMNIKVVSLPTYGFLTRYPTLGPAGLADIDVNGVAGSIELYLGRDALVDAGGALRKIQWTGFDNGVGKYQGEVLGKDDIHAAFKKKLYAAVSAPEQIVSQDWEGVRLVLGELFSAFHSTDATEIIAWDAFEPSYA